MFIFAKFFVYIFLVLCVFACQSKEDCRYNTFLENLKADEVYIGFFAAEEKCIREKTPAYLEARRRCFLAIAGSREEPFVYIETFNTFLENENLLQQEHAEEWNKVLTVLSFELYANMPIFDFEADNVVEHRHIIYARYPDKELALDLFLPKKPLAEPIPAVVCIHGGGWMANRRIWFEPLPVIWPRKALPL